MILAVLFCNILPKGKHPLASEQLLQSVQVWKHSHINVLFLAYVATSSSPLKHSCTSFFCTQPIRPSLLFLDAAFEVFLYLTAPPLAIRLNLGTPTLLLLTQIPHLWVKTARNIVVQEKGSTLHTTYNIRHHFSLPLSIASWEMGVTGRERCVFILCECVCTFLRCFLRSSLSSFDCFFSSFK